MGDQFRKSRKEYKDRSGRPVRPPVTLNAHGEIVRTTDLLHRFRRTDDDDLLERLEVIQRDLDALFEKAKK